MSQMIRYVGCAADRTDQHMHPQLDEEGLKEKRKQKLMKASSDARKLQRENKMAERRLKEEAEAREQDERDRDLEAWSQKMRREHEVQFHFGASYY